MNRVTRLVGLSAARPRRGSLWILTAFAMTAAAGIASVAGHSLIATGDDARAARIVTLTLEGQTDGDEGERQAVWVTTETVEGEFDGVWVTTQTLEGEATVQARAVKYLTLMKAYDDMVVEFVDEKEESGGLSLLTLAHRYLSRFVTDEHGNTFIRHLKKQGGDDERTAHFGRVELKVDALEIELQPGSEQGRTLMLRSVNEDGEAEEVLHGVYFDVVKPSYEIHVEYDNQKAGALQRHIRIAFDHMLARKIETKAEYHVLRKIYVNAKEGDEVDVKVIIKIEEDESGDQ